jgi:hypothetical protein
MSRLTFLFNGNAPAADVIWSQMELEGDYVE